MARISPFARFWAADAISSFGTAVTAAAMPVLVVQVLGATPTEVGVVNAAQFLPYAVLGLLAGAYTDRWRRKPVLVWAAIGRGLCLGAVPVLWAAGVLRIWMLVVALLAFGGFSVFGFAAAQSMLPRLVARGDLVRANARLDQTDATAATLGPALGGGLVGLLGAPVAITVDALSYLVEAGLNATLLVQEARPTGRRRLRSEIRDGLRWTYGHRVLGRLAVCTHVWFLANGAAMTVLSLLVLRRLDYTALAFGLLLAVFGVASLFGATVSAALGRRLGSGHVILLSRAVYPLGWLLVAASLPGSLDHVLPFVALGVLGLAAGLENAHEMALRQQLTPDELLGRVNATGRSVNRTMAAVGALAAGASVAAVGERAVLGGVVLLFAIAAALAATEPVRTAVTDIR